MLLPVNRGKVLTTSVRKKGTREAKRQQNETDWEKYLLQKPALSMQTTSKAWVTKKNIHKCLQPDKSSGRRVLKQQACGLHRCDHEEAPTPPHTTHRPALPSMIDRAQDSFFAEIAWKLDGMGKFRKWLHNHVALCLTAGQFLRDCAAKRKYSHHGQSQKLP